MASRNQRADLKRAFRDATGTSGELVALAVEARAEGYNRYSKKLYRKAEGAAYGPDDLVVLAAKVHESGYKRYARQLYDKAIAGHGTSPIAVAIASQALHQYRRAAILEEKAAMKIGDQGARTDAVKGAINIAWFGATAPSSINLYGLERQRSLTERGRVNRNIKAALQIYERERKRLNREHNPKAARELGKFFEDGSRKVQERLESYVDGVPVLRHRGRTAMKEVRTAVAAVPAALIIGAVAIGVGIASAAASARDKVKKAMQERKKREEAHRKEPAHRIPASSEAAVASENGYVRISFVPQHKTAGNNE